MPIISGITLDEVRAAGTTAKLNALVAKLKEASPGLKVEFPATMTNNGLKQWHMIQTAMEHGLLHDHVCKQLVDKSPQLQDELTALRSNVLEAQRVAAAAAADAAAAAANAATALEELHTLRAALTQVHTLRAELNELKASTKGVEHLKEEAADAAAAKMVETDAICFNFEFAKDLGVAGDAAVVQHTGSALFASACTELREAGVSEDAIGGLLSVRALRPQEGKSTPIVLTCKNVPSKVALLRAVRIARAATDDNRKGLQVAARLTRVQQKQRQTSLVRMKEVEGEARLWGGYKLQRKDDGKWVDVVA